MNGQIKNNVLFDRNHFVEGVAALHFARINRFIPPIPPWATRLRGMRNAADVTSIHGPDEEDHVYLISANVSPALENHGSVQHPHRPAIFINDHDLHTTAC